MNNDEATLKNSFIKASFIVALIWFVKLIEFSFDLDFSHFGIYPRTLNGSVGIITSPFIHGDFIHLLSNSFPVLILCIGLFYFYDRIAIPVLLLIYFITGFWVWIAAREAYHVGASGIIYGLLTFLLLSGFFRKDRSTLAFSFVVLFLYGTTLFTGVIPSEPGVSWESHLMGAIAGIFCSIYFINTKVTNKPTPQDISVHENDDELVHKPLNYKYTYQIKPPADTKEKKETTFTYTFTETSSKKKD